MDYLVLAFITLLAEANRVPFDIAEAESELVAGFQTEYSSIYFSMLVLSEYINIVLGNLLIVLMFNLFMFIFV